MNNTLSPHLEEETEADPLVVLVISPLQRVLGLVHPGVGHVEPDPLPEGAGDGVGGVYPAVSVEDVLGVRNSVFGAEVTPSTSLSVCQCWDEA